MSASDKEILLRVENLCQYFKSGSYENKAVDNVSFDIRKGEVFGLVGESGCGKTTTGRSIIKIYDITSGSIYFKGQRICAGTRSYRDAIKAARKELRSGADGERRKELEASISANREEIRKAKYDHKNADRLYAEKQVALVKEKYAKLLAESPNDAELKRRYKDELRVAKNTKLITQIQMIFQDPIASLDPRMTVREIISEGLVINGIRDREYIDEKVSDRRRAHLRAGRVHPGAGHQPDERAARPAGADDPVHRPRPERGKVFLRPHRRHVLRQYGGDGGLRRAVRPPDAPVYSLAALRDPPAGSALGEAPCAHHL